MAQATKVYYSDGSVQEYDIVGELDDIFSVKDNIVRVEIGDSVTSIGIYAFYECSGLTSVTIPYSITSIGDWAFYKCLGLTSVTIPNSVTSIGDRAFSMSNITSITIPNSVTSIGEFVFSGCFSLTSVTIPNSVTSIGAWAFFICSGLTSVNIPNSVTSIGSCAFQECSGLTSIIIPDSVTSIGKGAFGYCSNITSITIPDSVKTIDEGWYSSYGTFEGCNNLTSVIIGNGLTEIPRNAFNSCTNLTSVTFGNSVVSIGYGAFGVCSSLPSITIPDSVTSIGKFAFSTCTGLTSVNIGKHVRTIGEGAFVNCLNLNSITLPNSVDNIDGWSFSGCTNLTSVTIGNNVTSIGESAFDGCINLIEVTIPKSVRNIGDYAFWEVPTEGDLYCDDDWYNNLTFTVKHNLYNVYYWRRHNTPIPTDPIYSSTTTTRDYCNVYDWSRDEIIQYLSGYSETNLVEYSAITASTIVIEENSSEHCGYIPPEPDVIYSSTTTTIDYCVGYNWTRDTVTHYLSGYNTTNLVEYTATTATTVLEYNSAHCGYIPPEPIYSSTTTNNDYCDGYNWTRDTVTHYLSGYYETLLVEYSSTTVTTVLEHNSVDHCGYIPPEPIYSSTTTERQYCNGYDLMKDIVTTYYSGYSVNTLVQYDQETNTSLIQKNSFTCGYTPRPIDIKKGNKYALYRKQYSTDGGITWKDSPYYYADLIEENSSECII